MMIAKKKKNVHNKTHDLEKRSNYHQDNFPL